MQQSKSMGILFVNMYFAKRTVCLVTIFKQYLFDTAMTNRVLRGTDHHRKLLLLIVELTAQRTLKVDFISNHTRRVS